MNISYSIQNQWSVSSDFSCLIKNANVIAIETQQTPFICAYLSEYGDNKGIFQVWLTVLLLIKTQSNEHRTENCRRSSINLELSQIELNWIELNRTESIGIKVVNTGWENIQFVS